MLLLLIPTQHPHLQAAGKKFVLPRIIAPALTFHGDGRGQQVGLDCEVEKRSVPSYQTHPHTSFTKTFDLRDANEQRIECVDLAVLRVQGGAIWMDNKAVNKVSSNPS